ncbi:hypothetical protein PR048_027684 [Dryococelus australis]|uniref:Uncharacterized protein n=1 Tax=Dryococelus australis TaxID=614101 RepID=A0ABQ9GH70_9NEOP|nr:hypothetical protein PR048_027684 [Dryococelus australis]
MKGREKRDIPEKTRRSMASSGTIPTCKNPVTRPGNESQEDKCTNKRVCTFALPGIPTQKPSFTSRHTLNCATERSADVWTPPNCVDLDRVSPSRCPETSLSSGEGGGGGLSSQHPLKCSRTHWSPSFLPTPSLPLVTPNTTHCTSSTRFGPRHCYQPRLRKRASPPPPTARHAVEKRSSLIAMERWCGLGCAAGVGVLLWCVCVRARARAPLLRYLRWFCGDFLRASLVLRCGSEAAEDPDVQPIQRCDLDVESLLNPAMFSNVSERRKFFELSPMLLPMKVIEVNMERRQREGEGKTRYPRENPPGTASSGTIPTCESPVTRLGIEPSSPSLETSVLIAQPP